MALASRLPAQTQLAPDVRSPATSMVNVHGGENAPLNRQNTPARVAEEPTPMLDALRTPAQSSPRSGLPQTEQTFVVGGESRDRYENFIWALDLRLQQVESIDDLQKLSVQWFVEAHKKGGNYAAAKELMNKILEKHSKRLKHNIPLIEHMNQDEFFNYMNTGSQDGQGTDRLDRKISSWEFFGHGTTDKGLEPEYELDGTTDNIEVSEIDLFDPNAFTEDAYFKSWACNTGADTPAQNKNASLVDRIRDFFVGKKQPSWAEEYQEHVGGTVVAADGRTNYDRVQIGPKRKFLGFERELPYLGLFSDWRTFRGERPAARPKIRRSAAPNARPLTPTSRRGAVE